MKLNIVVVFFLAIAVTGCAKKSDSIAAAAVSRDKAAKISNLNCNQIREATALTDSKLARASDVQNSKANDDKLMVAGGVALFLPLLFFTEGNDGADNIAELKGVKDALEVEAARKKCRRPATALF